MTKEQFTECFKLLSHLFDINIYSHVFLRFCLESVRERTAWEIIPMPRLNTETERPSFPLFDLYLLA